MAEWLCDSLIALAPKNGTATTWVCWKHLHPSCKAHHRCGHILASAVRTARGAIVCDSWHSELDVESELQKIHITPVYIYILYKSITLHVFQNCKKLFLSFQPCSTEPVLAAWKRIADVYVGDRVFTKFFQCFFQSLKVRAAKSAEGQTGELDTKPPKSMLTC